MGIWIASTNLNRKRVLGFSVGLIVLVLVLIFFKYFELIRQTSLSILSLLGLNVFLPALDIVAPAGISFFTFQTISYSVDIYRNKVQPVKNLFDFGFYVSFFPQLVAGPIERATHLLPQFTQKRKFD